MSSVTARCRPAAEEAVWRVSVRLFLMHVTDICVSTFDWSGFLCLNRELRHSQSQHILQVEAASVHLHIHPVKPNGLIQNRFCICSE